MPTPKEAALLDLNIFSAIVALLEGGVIYTREGQRRAEKIIIMCKREASAQWEIANALDRAQKEEK